MKLDHPVRKITPSSLENKADRKSGSAGARGHGALRQKLCSRTWRVKLKQLYNGDDLRRLKVPDLTDFRASIQQWVAVAANHAENNHSLDKRFRRLQAARRHH